jgi:hypothetical protein
MCAQGRQIINRLNEFTRDEESWERLKAFLESQGVEVESKGQVRKMIQSTMNNICKGFILNNGPIDTQDFLDGLAQQGTFAGELGAKGADALKWASNSNLLGGLTAAGTGLGALALGTAAGPAALGGIGAALALQKAAAVAEQQYRDQNSATNRWLNWWRAKNAPPPPMPELDAANGALGYYASDSNVFEGIPALHNYLKTQGHHVMQELTVALNKVAKHTSGRIQREASNAGRKCQEGGELGKCAEALYSFCQVDVPEDLQVDDDTRAALHILAIMCAKQVRSSKLSKYA